MTDSEDSNSDSDYESIHPLTIQPSPNSILCGEYIEYVNIERLDKLLLYKNLKDKDKLLLKKINEFNYSTQELFDVKFVPLLNRNIEH